MGISKTAQRKKAEAEKAEAEARKVLPKDKETIRGDRGEYSVVRRLGAGAFGAVFLVAKKIDKTEFAMKCEVENPKKKLLDMDLHVLKAARKAESQHIVRMQDKGHIKGRFRFLIMDLVGKDLQAHRDNYNGCFSLGTALKAAIHALAAIRDVHDLGYLHRDIKPQNFASGNGSKAQTIFILDFGLARQFKVDNDKDIRKPREKAPFRGTARYASRHAHQGVEQSRRDDVEAWFYMTMEFTCGLLPWNGRAREELADCKEELYFAERESENFKDCPKEYYKIFKYVHDLEYISIPDYAYIYRKLLEAMDAGKVNIEDGLDWDPKNTFVLPVFKQ